MAKDRGREARAVRITTAAANRSDDIYARERRYLISMAIRTLCFVGAVIAAVAGLNWLWPLFMVGAVLLPYVAVVEANVAETRDDAFGLPDTGYQRELGPGEQTDAEQSARGDDDDRSPNA